MDENSVEIDELLAAFSVPALPEEALERAPGLIEVLRGLDKIKTVAMLAGLQTVPELQANLVRLDWAVRLALVLSQGDRTPSRAELNQLLNVELIRGRSAALEDPIEDFFVEPIATKRGDFLILTGTWEKAGFQTETLLEAFEGLPDGGPKADVLRNAYAALRLSDALVQRVGLRRRIIGGGNPKIPIELPSEHELVSIAARGFFTWEELIELGVVASDLEAFTLPIDRTDVLLRQNPGDSSLEHLPLLALTDGILVAAPSNLSTAIRSVLISAAVWHGLGDGLRVRLLKAQTSAVTVSGFASIPPVALQRMGAFLGAISMREVSKGRFVQFLVAVEDFADWPAQAFGSTRDVSADLGGAIASAIRQARDFLGASSRLEAGLTICFLAGWGRGCAVDPSPWSHYPDWDVIFLPLGDAAAMGRCEGGSVRDLWRLRRQVKLVEALGYTLVGVNGELNLFNWWRKTDYALVPPHWTDAAPPAQIVIGTDHLLEARREGLEALDRRALPFVAGEQHRVTVRMDPPGYVGELDPIYVSVTDALAGELLAAVVDKSRVVWVELRGERDQDSYDRVETWRAALYWLKRVLPAYEAIAPRGASEPVVVVLTVDFPEEGDGDFPEDIGETVQVSIGAGRRAAVHLTSDWNIALRHPENVAEVELATGLLAAIAALEAVDHSRAKLRSLVRKAVQSDAVRWRHRLTVSRAVDVLVAHSLLGRMRKIPVSAGALEKCGGGWWTRPRGEGSELAGADACGSFLIAHTSELLRRLCERVAEYERHSFITYTLDHLQSALGESRRWEMSARALRAIHGADGDHQGSLHRQGEVNAVIRSSTILLEIANAETRTDGLGKQIGDMDLAELQAAAMLLFQIGDSIPAILAGFAEPILHISPTGDVLFDHRFEDNTIKRSAELRHKAERERWDRAYASLIEDETPPRGVPPELASAISAEFNVEADVYLDLPAASARLAADSGKGLLIGRRSALVDALESFALMNGKRVRDLLDRLTMPARAGWSDIPPGFSNSDFDLTKFDRRASLVGRPVLILEAGEDPVLVLAPGVIERAVVHNLSGATSGSLQGNFWRSREMASFAGSAGDKAGIRFNERLAEVVRTAGMAAWAGAKPAWCLNCKATREVERLGDIDVLAVSPDGRRVWVIEAKDLKLCRTLGETSRRLSEYRGRKTPKGPDKMLRHLSRVEFIRANADRLVERLGLAGTPEVSGMMIVRSPQPMQYVNQTAPDARVVMFDDLVGVPWNEGWS